MEDKTEFTATLQEAVEEKRTDIEKNDLPQLKEHYRNFYSSYQSLYNILLRKSLITEDPYKYDKKASEIAVPSEKPFLESEKSQQLSTRLSDYDNQLDYLNSYFLFNLDYMTMPRIKKLAGLTRYFRWDQLSENSTTMNTRYLAEMVGKVKKGTDDLSVKLLNDALDQLSGISKKVLLILKTITAFHREEYKLIIRKTITSQLNLTPSIVQNRPDDVMKKIKKSFASAMNDQPFYAELIKEVLEEDYGPNTEQLREAVLDKLKVKEKKKKGVKKEDTGKTILLEAARILAGAGVHLDQALKKLQESHQILINRKISFGEKFRRWIMNFTGKKEEKHIYEVEYFDTKSSLSKHEKIDFTKFSEDVSKRSKVLASVSNKMSSGYQRLEASSEDRIFQFLSKNIQELQLFLRQIPALDTYFKTEASKEERQRIRGTKIEVNAIKNSVLKANKKRHEYTSKKEETEQLKRLGINMEEA